MAAHDSFRQFRDFSKWAYSRAPPEAWAAQPIDAALYVTQQAVCSTAVRSTGEMDALAESHYRSTFVNAVVAGLWEACGRPVVTLGHKTAAACATSRMLPDDAVAFVRPPWPAFVVRLPSPLLTIEDPDHGRLLDANLLLVAAIPTRLLGKHASTRASGSNEPESLRWWYKLAADTPGIYSVRQAHGNKTMLLAGLGMALWGFNLATSDLLVDDPSTMDEWQRWDAYGHSTQDQRTEALCKLLMMNVCLHVDAPNLQERVRFPGEVKVTERESKPDELGTYRVFDVQTGIKLNLCDAVRTYVRTGSTPKAYARMVSPHWKRVAYGAKHSLRRIQYIEAYWKGKGEE